MKFAPAAVAAVVVALLPFVLGAVNLVGGIAAIAQAFRMRSGGSAT